MDNNTGEHRLITIRNCFVTRLPMILTLGGISSSCLWDGMRNEPKLRMNAIAVLSILRTGVQALNGKQTFWFPHNSWLRGYHHWLAEIAVKFLIFEDELRTGLILIPADSPSYVTDFLKLFEFENVVKYRRTAFVKRLNVITSPRSGQFLTHEMELVRNRVLSRVGIEVPRPKRKVYVSRGDARQRHVVNEEDVSAALSTVGFEKVTLNEMAFTDQVRLFAECETVVSLHGAGLTNALFMPKTSRVIELYPEPEGHENDANRVFELLCASVSVSHEMRFCTRVRKGATPNFHADDILVDVDALLASLAGPS